MTTCAECGFTYEDVAFEQIPALLRSLGPRYRDDLAGAEAGAVTLRPAPGVWSALEYGCHVRDVLLVQRDRALLALVEDTPSFSRMHREERVRLAHYDAHSVTSVVEQLTMAAELCAVVFTGLSLDQWGRRLVYNWPDPAERDIAWLGQHSIHEAEHHLLDVRRVLARVATSS